MKHRQISLVVFFCVAWGGLVAGSAQTFNRSLFVAAREIVQGNFVTQSAITNFPGAGSTLNYERMVSASGSYGRVSAVADPAALRLAVKATSFAGLYGSFTDGSASVGFNGQDGILLISPEVSGSSAATARVRLLLDSQFQLLGDTNTNTISISAALQLGGTNWQLRSTSSFSNAEFFIDAPVTVNGTNGPNQTNALVLMANASSGANGNSIAPITAVGGISVTWGGIVSLTLSNNVAVTNFQALGLTGVDYRGQRGRGDKTVSITKTNASSIALRWAGSSNIFYQVEFSPTLNPGSWSPLNGLIEGNGNNIFSETISGNRFYRIADAPLP